MKKEIRDYCTALTREFALIPPKRKEKLRLLAEYMTQKFAVGQTPQITVICTHNSRRSHLGQIWLSVATDYYELPAAGIYSGGTEVTAFNPRAVNALRRVGFDISTDDKLRDNPHYNVTWKEEGTSLTAYSKTYDDPINPQTDYALVPVCTEADAACPVVPGADFRLPLPYDDPKEFDNTDAEEEKYDARVRQIGREMLYCCRRIQVG